MVGTNKTYLLLFLLLACGFGAQAAERGTMREARLLAERAVAHVAEVGRSAAMRDFNDAGSDFVLHDLYVFVLELDGTVLAHGSKAAYVGKNLSGVRDAAGRAFVDVAIETAVRRGSAWTEPYLFPDPLTGRMGTKRSFVILHEDLVLGVGAYR